LFLQSIHWSRKPWCVPGPFARCDSDLEFQPDTVAKDCRNPADHIAYADPFRRSVGRIASNDQPPALDSFDSMADEQPIMPEDDDVAGLQGVPPFEPQAIAFPDCRNHAARHHARYDHILQ
jgi:hypothetical protein